VYLTLYYCEVDCFYYCKKLIVTFFLNMDRNLYVSEKSEGGDLGNEIQSVLEKIVWVNEWVGK